MRVAMIPLKVVPGDIPQNTERVIRWMARAAREAADLVLFPEAALTGLINTDDPTHDRALGIPRTDEALQRIAQATERFGVYVGLGFLEREGEGLYDSAVMFSSQGEMILHYRRITPGWHGMDADARTYRDGSRLGIADTPWGQLGVLICGDLFDEDLVHAVRDLEPRWVWVPMARAAPSAVKDIPSWWEEERSAYVSRIRKLRAWGFLVNLREPMPYHAFGGTLVVDPRGNLRAMTPPFHADMHMIEIPLDKREAFW